MPIGPLTGKCLVHSVRRLAAAKIYEPEEAIK